MKNGEGVGGGGEVCLHNSTTYVNAGWVGISPQTRWYVLPSRYLEAQHLLLPFSIYSQR